MEDLKNIIESLLFVSDTPLTIERFKDVLETVDTKTIRQALQELSQEYESRQGSISLKEVAGGFQIRTRPEYHDWIKRLLKPSPHRLSKAALETLSIIAYKQPIIRSDVEHLRGVDCGGVLRVLMEKKLIRTLGRKEIPGRPLIYATTKRFLEVFDLKDLKDLPTPKEIEAIGDLPFPDEGSLPEGEKAPQDQPDNETTTTKETNVSPIDPQNDQNEPPVDPPSSPTPSPVLTDENRAPAVDQDRPLPNEKPAPGGDKNTLEIEAIGDPPFSDESTPPDEEGAPQNQTDHEAAPTNETNVSPIVPQNDQIEPPVDPSSSPAPSPAMTDENRAPAEDQDGPMSDELPTPDGDESTLEKEDNTSSTK